MLLFTVPKWTISRYFIDDFPMENADGSWLKPLKPLKSSAQHLSMRCRGLGAPGGPAGKRSSAMALPENLKRLRGGPSW